MQAVAVKEKPSYTPTDLASLNTQIGACLAVQRTYGKQAADLAAVTRVFASDLAGYEPSEVIKALAEWRLKSAEFPTPADIRNLLDPQPIWSAALFQEISDRRRKGDNLSYSEEEYLKGYKKHAMRGY